MSRILASQNTTQAEGNRGQRRAERLRESENLEQDSLLASPLLRHFMTFNNAQLKLPFVRIRQYSLHAYRGLIRYTSGNSQLLFRALIVANPYLLQYFVA